MIEQPARPDRARTPAPTRPILLVPDAALRRHARPVAAADRAAAGALAQDMLAAMYAAPGIGLAAPQVGVPLRLVVLDLAGDDERPAPLILFNPVVTGASDERAVREEGCLSLPGFYADVERPARVTVGYEDAEGVRRSIDADGLLAVCLQHEIDHLDGVLFVDHLSPLRRNMLLRRYAKERRAPPRPERSGGSRTPAA